MGKKIRVKPNLIKPSQGFLKEDTLRFILECISKGEENNLPPTPIVRCNPETEGYIAIDGHNLLAINLLLGRECEVFVAENVNDQLTIKESPESSKEALHQRNLDLAEKFDQVLGYHEELKKDGIYSFQELIEKYPFLWDFKK